MDQSHPSQSPPKDSEPAAALSTETRKRFRFPKNKITLTCIGTLGIVFLLSSGYFAASYLYPTSTSKAPANPTTSTPEPVEPPTEAAINSPEDTEPSDSTQTPPPVQNPPAPAPTPSPPYIKNALVIKYFPLTADKKYIDSSITGDVGNSYPEIKQKTTTLTNNLIESIKKSTTYQGYKQPNAPPSIEVRIRATFEHTKAFPYINNPLYPKHPGNNTPQPKYKIDYQSILSEHNICTYVTKYNISQVYIWAYSGLGSATGEIRAWESNMSGPHGNISNSYWEDDMPHCGKTYVVYVFNYGRGTAEALHSWGHQIEREMKAASPEIFQSFQGPESAGLGQSGTARCGSVHHPPNSRKDYDYTNQTAYLSDCLSGSLDSTGAVTPISCKVWGCQDISDTNNPHLNYQIWMWQNLPGHGNTLSFKGKSISNMWYVHGDFDKAMTRAKELRR